MKNFKKNSVFAMSMCMAIILVMKPIHAEETIKPKYIERCQLYNTKVKVYDSLLEKGVHMFSFTVGVDVSGTRGYVTSGSFSIQCIVPSNISSVSGYCGYITVDRKSDFLATASAIWYSTFTNNAITLAEIG